MNKENQYGSAPLGGLDVYDYLQELARTTGRRWCICVAATGEQCRTKHLLLSVCEYRAGAPIVRDDIAITSEHWPSVDSKRLEVAMWTLLYRFDRRMAERGVAAEEQAAF